MVHDLPIERVAARAVEQKTRFVRALLGAERGPFAFAHAAVAARSNPGQHDTVADGERCDSRTDCFDGAGAFVPEH